MVWLAETSGSGFERGGSGKAAPRVAVPGVPGVSPGLQGRQDLQELAQELPQAVPEGLAETPRAYQLHTYPAELYNFAAVVSASLGEPRLERLGLGVALAVRTRETDQRTPWHRRFYDHFPSWEHIYRRFILERIAPLFDKPFHYQRVPTLRVHLPGNVAVGEFHTDSDYGHPPGEVSFWLPLTSCYDTNSIWLESAPGRGDYKPVEVGPGTMMCFDANHLRHGNFLNATGVTRVSFDFRCLRVRDRTDTGQRTVNTQVAFVPGGYYSAEAVEPGA